VARTGGESGTLRLVCDYQREASRRGLSGDFVAIGVANTGCGTFPDALPHLFEPSFTNQRLGTGLGLRQVYGFAK
jgi:C4-dicarboxylate-specific signal transduction histidine kinase